MSLVDGIAWNSIFSVVSVLFGGITLYFVIKTYYRRPKLRLSLIDNDSLQRFYLFRDTEDTLNTSVLGSSIYLRLSNSGKAVATNVTGRIEFDTSFLKARSTSNSINPTAISGNVELTYDRVGPDPKFSNLKLQTSVTLEMKMEINQSGTTRLNYWLMCDEGVSTEGHISLAIPERETFTDDQMIEFLKLVHESRKQLREANIESTFRAIGNDLGLSESQLCQIFELSVNSKYIAPPITVQTRTGNRVKCISDGSTKSVTLDGKTFTIAKEVELSNHAARWLQDEANVNVWQDYISDRFNNQFKDK